MYELVKNNSVYFAVLIGLIAGIPLVMTIEKPDMHNSRWRAIPLSVLFSAVGVFSVLLFASLENVIKGEGFSVGAVSTYGLYLIAPIVLLILIRKERALRFDQYALYVLPSLFIQRIRCMFTGCCYGKLIAGTEMRWPTRESELVFYAIALIVFLYLERNEKIKKGALFPLLMICYGAFRLINEFFRDNGTGIFHLAHLWSIITLIIGVCLYTELSLVKSESKNKGNKRGKK